jgi:hypothetical protein
MDRTPLHHPRSKMISAPPNRRWFGAGLIVTGAGLAVNSVLGPLFTGILFYPVTKTMLLRDPGGQRDSFS